MNNSRFRQSRRRNAATDVFSSGCVETKGLNLAPREERKYEFADGETGREYFLQGVNTRGDFGFASGGHRRLQGANRLPGIPVSNQFLCGVASPLGSKVPT